MMKTLFNKNPDNKVQFSDESLKVKKVRITISNIIQTSEWKKVQTNVSSPTSIKDQALSDHVSFNQALAADDDRHTESGKACRSLYSCGVRCPTSSNSTYTEEKCDDDTSQSHSGGEVLMKRWREIRQNISTKIEEMHDSFDAQFQKVCIDDFGQSAMMSMAKNRSKMDDMMMNMNATEMKYSTSDIISPPGCPIMPFDNNEKHTNNNNNDNTQLLQSETTSTATSTSTPLDRITACSRGNGKSLVCDMAAYQSIMVTCTDMMGDCNKVVTNDNNDNDDIIILVQLPSDVIHDDDNDNDQIMCDRIHKFPQ